MLSIESVFSTKRHTSAFVAVLSSHEKISASDCCDEVIGAGLHVKLQPCQVILVIGECGWRVVVAPLVRARIILDLFLPCPLHPH